MVLIDNNILSTFARVSAMDLLFTLFPRQQLGVIPAVRNEVLEAIEQGCAWLQDIVRLIEAGRLQLVALTPEELAAIPILPDSFGDGERECVAVCQARGWTFLTNDKRARDYCQQTGVEAYDLAGLLRALWESGLKSKRFVRQLADRMEAAEGMVIKNKEAIFRR
jgi:predicted nucleic acid-binding protein